MTVQRQRLLVFVVLAAFALILLSGSSFSVEAPADYTSPAPRISDGASMNRGGRTTRERRDALQITRVPRQLDEGDSLQPRPTIMHTGRSSEGEEPAATAAVDPQPKFPGRPRREEAGNSAPESLNVYRSRPTKCPERYLVFGNNFGRHNNQLTSLVAGIALASAVGRTAVIAPFSYKKEGSIDPRSIYDFTQLRKYFCVVFHDELFSENTVRGGKVRDVVVHCIVMRGIETFPQHPAGHRYTCSGARGVSNEVGNDAPDTTFVKFKKKFPLVYAAIVRNSDATYLTLPLIIYIAEAQELSGLVLCVWRYLTPHASLLQGVRRAMQHIGIGGNGNGGKTFCGVHARSLEGSCASRSAQFASNVADRTVINDQCVMGVPYVRRACGADPNSTFLWFLADDGQRPERRKKILAAGATVVEDATRFLSSGDGGDRFAHPRLASLLVDFWALVEADIFVGNQMSTLSVNVCRRRLSIGRPCDNFTPNYVGFVPDSCPAV